MNFEKKKYAQLELWPEEPCRVIVSLKGSTFKIERKTHSYAWSGAIPCTGVYRCVYCGKIK